MKTNSWSAAPIWRGALAIAASAIRRATGWAFPSAAANSPALNSARMWVEAIDATAMEEWNFDSFDLFLFIGLKPDGEFVGGDMNEVIEYNTSKLTDEDRDALAAFFTRHGQDD